MWFKPIVMSVFMIGFSACSGSIGAESKASETMAEIIVPYGSKEHRAACREVQLQKDANTLFRRKAASKVLELVGDDQLLSSQIQSLSYKSNSNADHGDYAVWTEDGRLLMTWQSGPENLRGFWLIIDEMICLVRAVPATPHSNNIVLIAVGLDRYSRSYLLEIDSISGLVDVTAAHIDFDKKLENGH